jgi:hypothetical protein
MTLHYIHPAVLVIQTRRRRYSLSVNHRPTFGSWRPWFDSGNDQTPKSRYYVAGWLLWWIELHVASITPNPQSE